MGDYVKKKPVARTCQREKKTSTKGMASGRKKNKRTQRGGYASLRLKGGVNEEGAKLRWEDGAQKKGKPHGKSRFETSSSAAEEETRKSEIPSLTGKGRPKKTPKRRPSRRRGRRPLNH